MHRKSETAEAYYLILLLLNFKLHFQAKGRQAVKLSNIFVFIE